MSGSFTQSFTKWISCPNRLHQSLSHQSHAVKLQEIPEVLLQMRGLLVDYGCADSLNCTHESNCNYVTNCSSPNIPGRQMFIYLDYISVVVQMFAKCHILATFHLYCWTLMKYIRISLLTLFIYSLSLTSQINVAMSFK